MDSFLFAVTLVFSLFLQKSNGLARSHVRSPSYGDKFVLVAPRMTNSDSQVILFLYSTADKPITVIISSRWFADDTTQYSYMQINRLQVTTYIMETKYRPTLNTGFTWTYRLSGSDLFGVTVMLVYAYDSMASFQAAPVIAWGQKYYVMTLSPSAFVAILSYHSHNKIDMKIKATGNFLLTFQGKSYYNGDVLHMLLNNTEAFILSYCEDSTEYNGALTGTQVVGSDPIGVFSGTCKGSTKVNYCNSPIEYKGSRTDDILADMLIPFNMYGKRFIDLIILERKTNGLIVVVAGENDTTINFNSSFTRYLAQAGDYTTVYSAGGPSYFTSNKGVMVIYLQPSACFESTGNTMEMGDVTMSVLVPMELFYDSYAWIFLNAMFPTLGWTSWERGREEEGEYLIQLIPPHLSSRRKNCAQFQLDRDWVWEKSRDTFDCARQTESPMYGSITPVNYVALVVMGDKSMELRLDFEPIKNVQHGRSVVNLEEWCVLNRHVPPGVHIVTAATDFTFGCYAYGIDMGYAYMHHVGFLNFPVNEPCVHTNTSQGDLVDNDCDGVTDEEEDDDEDNDDDGFIDEDLKRAEIKINGNWSEWTEWTCSLNCNDTRLMRRRFCKSPVPKSDDYFCEGDHMEYNESNCHIGEKACGNHLEEGLEMYTEPVLTEEWSHWLCSRNCSDTRVFERRKCRELFHCNNIRVRSGKCYIGKKCPFECPLDTWGVNCLYSCSNCLDACDKFNGSCKVCMDGFDSPQTSCNRECPKFFYGAACLGSCKDKCGGQDCLNRMQGLCPQGPYLYLAIIPVACTLPVIAFVYVMKTIAAGKKRQEDQTKIIEDVAVEPVAKPVAKRVVEKELSSSSQL